MSLSLIPSLNQTDRLSQFLLFPRLPESLSRCVSLSLSCRLTLVWPVSPHDNPHHWCYCRHCHPLRDWPVASLAAGENLYRFKGLGVEKNIYRSCLE